MLEELDEIKFEDLSKFRKKEDAPEFPLVRIVGQQHMKKALLLLISNPAIGNLLLVGEAGIGKVTSAKGLKSVLPEIEVVKDCEYNCGLKDKDLCLKCQAARGKKMDILMKPTPFIELRIGSSEKVLFGGFGHAGKFKPGLIGSANRGVLMIEKANLLRGGVLKKLLDVSEAGVYKHEQDKKEYVHPAKFVIVATLNPDDGELDEEVMSRFRMIIDVNAIKEIEERIEIVRRVEAYKEDPLDFMVKSRRETDAFKERIRNSRKNIRRVDVPKKVQTAINKVLKEVNQDNDWTKDALVEAAKANAVFDDRLWVTVEDVAEVAEMVLGYRVES